MRLWFVVIMFYTSSYDEKIVFSGDYKQYFINFLRALDSDQDVILIGEKGVGKRSMARSVSFILPITYF